MQNKALLTLIRMDVTNLPTQPTEVSHYVETLLTYTDCIQIYPQPILSGERPARDRPIELQRKPYQPDSITYQLSSSSQNINGKSKK